MFFETYSGSGLSGLPGGGAWRGVRRGAGGRVSHGQLGEIDIKGHEVGVLAKGDLGGEKDAGVIVVQGAVPAIAEAFDMVAGKLAGTGNRSYSRALISTPPPGRRPVSPA